MTGGMQSSTANPYKIMLVDDSATIRAILKKILEDVAIVEVVGEAENGKLAIDTAKSLQPDIILLDIEMPEMDGITALPHILQASPHSQIIMVSTLTAKNAEISIKAMGRGAADCLQKPAAGIDKDDFKAELVRKIQALGYASKEMKFKTSTSKINLATQANTPAQPIAAASPKTEPVFIKPDRPLFFRPEAIAIASSTGGPQALEAVIGGLKNNIPNLPIFITQHMPPVFTKYLAGSLSSANNVECIEATDGMEVLPGKFYIAPGDFHMLAKIDGTKIKILLNQDPPENFCRPAADPMLRSLLEVYGNKLLVVVLTGMGQDGLLGAIEIAKAGGIVIAQDKATSVVWGMPGAVCEAGITNGIYPLDDIAGRIIELCASKGVHNAT